MALTPGTKLGPYEIRSPIGAGGMGEVYEAQDSRLDRTVAIKILPARFSSDADLRLRFEREARSWSASWSRSRTLRRTRALGQDATGGLEPTRCAPS